MPVDAQSSSYACIGREDDLPAAAAEPDRAAAPPRTQLYRFDADRIEGRIERLVGNQSGQDLMVCGKGNLRRR